MLLTFPLMTGLYLFFGFSASAILSAVLVIWVSFAASQYLESGLSFRVQIALSLQYLLCAALGYIAEKDKKHWSSQITTDFLTSIPNRRAIYKWLEENILKCKANNSDLALYFIDIDRFKAINDQYGHAVGDQLLAAFSMRLRNSFRAVELSKRKGNVFIARLSGDEFVVAVRDIDVIKSLQAFKKRIVDVSCSPFRIENQKIRIALSIGVELASNCDYDHKALLDRSDKKMYIDKKLSASQKVKMNDALKENEILK